MLEENQAAVADTTLNQNSVNNYQAYNPARENPLEKMLIKGDYAWLWNQYVKGIIRFQENLTQINQGILRFYGLPTREELRRVNIQLFDLNNRLDEIETRLDNK